MPKTLYIRDIPERIYQKPKKQANLWEEVDALRERIYSRHGPFGDSAPLICEDRER